MVMVDKVVVVRYGGGSVRSGGMRVCVCVCVEGGERAPGCKGRIWGSRTRFVMVTVHADLDRPKSATLAIIFASRRMFPLFMSRCCTCGNVWLGWAARHERKHEAASEQGASTY